MYYPSNIYPPVKNNFQDSLTQNHRQVKSLQTNYLTQQYQKNIQAKRAAKQAERRQKQIQLNVMNHNNQIYINQVNMSRQRRFQQKHNIAHQYQQAMENKRYRDNKYKEVQKQYQMNLLNDKYHKWMRTPQESRQITKSKMANYNSMLEGHVRQQEYKKNSDKAYQDLMKQRINSQAQMLLNRQYQHLEAQHRRRSMFQQRQNALLGISNSTNNQLNSSRMSSNNQQLYDYRTQLNRNERALYKAGLQQQKHMQQERKKNKPKQQVSGHQSYNPITNPVPFIYKNPNVLKMMVSGR